MTGDVWSWADVPGLVLERVPPPAPPSRMGRPRIGDVHDQAIQRCHLNLKWSVARIAGHIGISEPTVRQRLRVMGLV